LSKNCAWDIFVPFSVLGENIKFMLKYDVSYRYFRCSLSSWGVPL
jgi:hypothetical protein